MHQVQVFLAEFKGGIFQIIIPQIYSEPALICEWLLIFHDVLYIYHCQHGLLSSSIIERQ